MVPLLHADARNKDSTCISCIILFGCVCERLPKTPQHTTLFLHSEVQRVLKTSSTSATHFFKPAQPCDIKRLCQEKVLTNLDYQNLQEKLLLFKKKNTLDAFLYTYVIFPEVRVQPFKQCLSLKILESGCPHQRMIVDPMAINIQNKLQFRTAVPPTAVPPTAVPPTAVLPTAVNMVNLYEQKLDIGQVKNWDNFVCFYMSTCRSPPLHCSGYQSKTALLVGWCFSTYFEGFSSQNNAKCCLSVCFYYKLTIEWQPRAENFGPMVELPGANSCAHLNGR